MTDPIRSLFRRRVGRGAQPRGRRPGRAPRSAEPHSLAQESLERRLALAIAVDDFAGFVDLRDPNFVDGYAIIASDNADNVFIKQVSTAPQDLLVADNSSFLNYKHIDGIDADSSPAGQAYRDVFITNGSRVSPEKPLAPVQTASNTTQFRLGVQAFDSWRTFNGKLSYTQADGTESVWDIQNYASDADLYDWSLFNSRSALRTPSSQLRITGGPGYVTGGTPSPVGSGWVRPLSISYVPGQEDPNSLDNGQATVTVTWSGLVDPRNPPSLSFSLYATNDDTEDRNFNYSGDYRISATANALISSSNSVAFALPDPFNKDSLGVIPGSLSGSIDLEVAGATGRFSFPVRALPNGAVMFFQTLPFPAFTGFNGRPITGWTDVAIIETDGFGDSGYILVRGNVAGNDLTLSFSESDDSFLPETATSLPNRAGNSTAFNGFRINWERSTNVATFASLSSTYLVYNQDSQPNTVTFAPGHTFTREPTVDLLTPASSLVVNSPIDVNYEVFRAGSPPSSVGSVDLRVTNIDVNAPVYAPWRVDIGHSQTGDSERLTVPGESSSGIFPRNRFLSPTYSRDYSPFRGNVATAFASSKVSNDGKGTLIGDAAVLSEGSGYDPANPPVVTVAPPAADSGAATVTAISGSVRDVTVIASGGGYARGATATFSRPSAGSLGSISVNFGGSGYTTAPYVEIVGGGGTGATAVATVNAAGAITAITVTNPGRDYTSEPTIRFVGGGTGAIARAVLAYDTATGEVDLVDDRVVSVRVTNPGKGYFAPPTITILGVGAGRPGSGAVAVASITAEIATVRVTNQGKNYLDGIDVPDQVVDGVVNAVITSPDVSASFAQIQIPVINGELRDDFVESITVVDGGSGYDQLKPPTVTLLGGQSSTAAGNVATATAVVDPLTRRITSIKVTNGGRLYTQAPRVQIEAPPAGGSTATAYAVLGAVKFIPDDTSRGSGYTNLASITVDVPNAPVVNGKTAEFRAIVSADGRITGVELVDGGLGYTSAPEITIAPPPYQRPATASARFDVSTGAVTTIDVIDAGFRYKTAPLVVIEPPPSGLGEPARAVAELDASGRVTGIRVIDGGRGYTARPRVQIANPTPVNHTEMIAVDADLRAPIYEIYVGDDFGTERPKGQLRIAPSVSFAQKPVDGVSARATDLYIEATTADIVVEGSIRADRQTYLLNSDSFHARLAPYYFTTRSLATNLQNDSSLIEGGTVAITLGNDAPTPASGASAFNVVDLKTKIDSLRVTAATSTPNPAGAFPYVMSIDERDSIKIDAVAASSLPISIRATDGIDITSALATQGDLSIDSGAKFTVSSPISSTIGQLLIAADDIQVNNSIRVPNATVTPGRTDISLFAREGSIRMVGDVLAVNNVDLRQQVGLTATGLPSEGGVIDALNARITAENIQVQSGGSVSLRTSATSLSGLASTGFLLRESDDITIPMLEVPKGLVLLHADGVDRGDKGRNPIALTAKLRSVVNLFVSTPNGSADVTDDTNKELVLGNGPQLYTKQGAAEAMQAAGNVTIRSLGGSIVALDAPEAGGSARTVRLATQNSLPTTTTYNVGTPGVFGSTLSGPGSINSVATPPSKGITETAFGMPPSTVLAVGDLVLVKNQGASSPQNGIYRVTKVGGGVLGSLRWELTRDAASDTADEMAPGTFVRVLEGPPGADPNRIYRVDYNTIPTTLVDRANGNQIQLPADFAYANLITAGKPVSGTGIAPNSKVKSYDSATNVVTLEGAAPGAINSVTTDSKIVFASSFTSYSQLSVGQSVYGDGISPGAKIIRVDPLTRSITVTPGSVPLTTLNVAVDGAPFSGVGLYPEFFDEAIKLGASFNDFADIRVGQLVSGPAGAFAPGARVTGIDPVARTIGLNAGAILDPTKVGSITFEMPKSASFGVVQGSGAGYATFSMDPIGVVPIQFTQQTVTTNIGSDDSLKMLTFVVSTTGTTNAQAGSLGKMLGLFQANVTASSISNPDQDTSFRFWQFHPGSIRLTQELPTINRPVSIDGSLKYTGTAGVTGVTPANNAIFVDGSLITTTNRGSRVLTATFTKVAQAITVDAKTITLRPSETTTGLLAGMVVVGEGIRNGTRIASVDAKTKTVTLDTPALASPAGATLTFRADNVNGFVFNKGASGDPSKNEKGSTLRNVSVGGYTGGSAILVNDAKNVLLDRLTLGIIPTGVRASNEYGIVVTGNAAQFNTIKDSRIVGSVQAGIRLEAGANANRIVGTTVGSADVNNSTGIEVVAANRNLIGTDEILPLSTPRTISAKVVSDSTSAAGTVLEVSGGLSFGYPLVGLQVFDTLPQSTRIPSDGSPVRIKAVDTLINRIYLDNPIFSNDSRDVPLTTPIRVNTTLSLFVANGGQTTAKDDPLTENIDERTILTLNGNAAGQPGVNINDLFVGQAVTGVNIAPGTVITGIDPGTRRIVLSQPAVGPDTDSDDDLGWGWIAFGAGGRNTVQSNRTGISVVTGDGNRITNTTVINNTLDGIAVRGGSGTLIGSDGTQSLQASTGPTSPTIPMPRTTATATDYNVYSYAVTVSLSTKSKTVQLPASFSKASLEALKNLVARRTPRDPAIERALLVANEGAVLLDLKYTDVNVALRQITLSDFPKASIQNAQLAFFVRNLRLSADAAPQLYVGQTVHANAVPEFTTITGLRTARTDANVPGVIIISTPRSTNVSVSNFVNFTNAAEVVFANLGSTSNVIYGNKGFGVNVATAANATITRNNFAAGLSGERQAANVKGNVNVSLSLASKYKPRKFDVIDAAGNRHGASPLSTTGISPNGPSTPTV